MSVPSSLNWGNVLQSSGPPVIPTMSYVVTNNASYSIGVNVQPSDSRFTTSPAGPVVTIPPNSSQTITVTLTTTSALGAINATSFNVSLTANVVATGSATYAVNPVYNNFGNIRVGQNSAPLNIVITNTGSVNISITGITTPYADVLLGSLPSFPYNLVPGTPLTITAAINGAVRGLVDHLGAVVIAATGFPNSTVELVYTGFTITPAYTLTGRTQDVLYGLSGNWSTMAANYTARAVATIPTEADAGWTKYLNVTDEASNAFFKRLFMLFEPTDFTTPTIIQVEGFPTQGEGNEGQDTKSRNISADATGIPNSVIFDVLVNGEALSINCTIQANQGIASLIAWTPEIEPRGSIYEST